jgi:GGDEF domain-containing protein
MESVSVPVTISFGISSFIEESYEEAIKVIDKLMYKDKKRNKNILTHK